MSSRTYIQMLLKLNSAGKLPLCKELLDELNKYNAVLENHSEAIEELVRRRVEMIKHAKTVTPNIKILYYHYVIFEKCALYSMFMAELIEPVMFDDFDISPHLKGTTMGFGFQDDISNAVVKIVDKE